MSPSLFFGREISSSWYDRQQWALGIVLDSEADSRWQESLPKALCWTGRTHFNPPIKESCTNEVSPSKNFENWKDTNNIITDLKAGTPTRAWIVCCAGIRIMVTTPATSWGITKTPEYCETKFEFTCMTVGDRALMLTSSNSNGIFPQIRLQRSSKQVQTVSLHSSSKWLLAWQLLLKNFIVFSELDPRICPKTLTMTILLEGQAWPDHGPVMTTLSCPIKQVGCLKHFARSTGPACSFWSCAIFDLDTETRGFKFATCDCEDIQIAWLSEPPLADLVRDPQIHVEKPAGSACEITQELDAGKLSR